MTTVILMVVTQLATALLSALSAMNDGECPLLRLDLSVNAITQNSANALHEVGQHFGWGLQGLPGPAILALSVAADRFELQIVCRV